MNWTGRLVTTVSYVFVNSSIDRNEPAHLVDQVINYMEGIGDTSDRGDNRMGQLFAASFPVDGSAAL